MKLFKSLFGTSKKLSISDDSGFLGILNAQKYKSFVDTDWQLKQLMDHFIIEMNNQSIAFWATGFEDRWTILFVEEPSKNKSFREFFITIEVTDKKLYLTNYEDLTMAAQFDDIKMPAKHHADLYIPLENGFYNLTIRQMFDPANVYDQVEDDVNFEVVVVKTKAEITKVDSIPWWKA